MKLLVRLPRAVCFFLVASMGVVHSAGALGDDATSADGDGFRPHAGMLLYPDVSDSQIVFVYANDLWVVPRTGGTAAPLASPPGRERFPRFNADGRTIAFVGNYDGNQDLYTIGIGGEIASRVTHHPATEILCDWTPDGELLYFSNGLAGLTRQMQLFTVPPAGGLPTRMPVPYGANGAVSADGNWLAYTPHTRDTRTWKRYRGGMATNIWLFHLHDHTWKPITDWEGTDTLPMWHGDVVYYVSDEGPEHRWNVWSYSTKTGARTQITSFSEYDVKWPSMGPGPAGQGEIVFQNGSGLYLLDLGTKQAEQVEITIPGDRPALRPQRVDASRHIQAANISGTGKRVAFEARGDLWSVPAEHGSPRNLTRTSGSAERDPAWSPDGRWIAYFCDSTGEYQLCVTQSDGRGETRQLTQNGNRYRYRPTWSPDSKSIVFSDKAGGLFLHDIDQEETKAVDVDPWSNPPRVSWSHDSGWFAYSKEGQNNQRAIWLYEVASAKKHQVTAGVFDDSWPTFDRKGDLLFFVSKRKFTQPAYEDLGTTFIYAGTELLLAVPLRDDVASPWAPKNDEESWDDESKDENSDDDEDKSEKGEDEESDDNGDGDEDDEPLEIDLDGFERRAIVVPVEKGRFFNPTVSHDGKLIYARGYPRGDDRKPSIKILDLEDDKRQEKTVVSDTGNFSITADGKKLLVRKDKWYVVKAAAEQKLEKPIDVSGLKERVDPRAEWQQIFNDSWRIQRDFFYDPNMHAVDWPAIKEQYAAMLDDCATREDVSYVIGEMISEINVGHAYMRGGGDVEQPPRVSVGLLGVDFELHEGAYRIAKIYEGAAWDVDARGPLSQPGVEAEAGDYLLAVNGLPLETSLDPWAAFQGLAGGVVTITLNGKPALDDDARDVVVKLLSSEADLRYRAWVEHNRAYVEQQTGGRVGYLHVPNTGISGQNELVRQFFGQKHKAALIIDERWNAGGQIPTRFIELLNRPITNYWAVRDGHDWNWPPDAHQGPKCMLINGLAGSGGDAFPAYFRQAGLGKLIGMRTWGGLVGISGNPLLIDGGRISAPTFAYYESDGTWGVEGHGVDPDIEVIDDPSKMVDQGDPQLDAGIEHILGELERRPYRAPKRPAYPNRSGFGITEADK